jgi:hypothetical protein
MSYDFALAKVCTHQILEEPVFFNPANVIFIDAERRFIRFPKDVGSVDTIEVFVDGIMIPRSGLITPGTIKGVNRGPFKIVRNHNDLLKIRVHDSGLVRTVSLPIGNLITINQIADKIQEHIYRDDIEAVVEDGKLVIQDVIRKDFPRFSVIDPRVVDKDEVEQDTHRILRACSMLGVVPGRVACGRRTFPGWDPKSVSSSWRSDPGIEFHYPIPNLKPTIKINYVSLPTTCSRCHGSLFEYDYSEYQGNDINSHGIYETVRDLDLLNQEFDKFMFTERGSHFKWPWYGSDIINIIGSKATGNDNPTLTLSINNAFNTYRNIKMQQATQFASQDVTVFEMPKSLSRLRVVADPSDPTVYIADIAVDSSGIDTSSYTRPITLLRDPFAKIGLSQQMGLGNNSGYILR